MKDMGKAMMGTGESSGERRAIQAAEAAIANPLLDESSMKGAKGLLISITGGSDLTLYEVDEAASRIRQEIDEDASVILGATFDSALEGIVRVSVVATGIDKAQASMVSDLMSENIYSPHEATAIKNNLRANEAVESLKEFSTSADTQMSSTRDEVQAAAFKAFAEAKEKENTFSLSMKNNTLVENAHNPSLFVEKQESINREYKPHYGLSEDLYREEAVVKSQRMPSIEDLPIVAQKQLNASKSIRQDSKPVETKRMSILQKLALVGLGGRRKEVEEYPHYSESEIEEYDSKNNSNSVYPTLKNPVSFQNQPKRVKETVNHGFEEDHLEIPAFLRKKYR